MLHLCFLMRPLRGISFTYAICFFSAHSHQRFTRMVSVSQLYQHYNVGTPSSSGNLSPSPIPLLLSEASLPLLRDTLTHFALSSYEGCLVFQPLLKIRRVHSLAHAFSYFPQEGSPCLISLPFLQPTFLYRRDHSDQPVPCQGATVSHVDPLPPHEVVIWMDGSVPFPLDKAGSSVLAICSLGSAQATLFYSAGPVCSSFSAEANAIMQALRWSRWQHQDCYFSSVILLSPSLCFCDAFLSSILPFISHSLDNLAETTFFLLLYHQVTNGFRPLVSP